MRKHVTSFLYSIVPNGLTGFESNIYVAYKVWVTSHLNYCMLQSYMLYFIMYIFPRVRYTGQKSGVFSLRVRAPLNGL